MEALTSMLRDADVPVSEEEVHYFCTKDRWGAQGNTNGDKRGDMGRPFFEVGDTLLRVLLRVAVLGWPHLSPVKALYS